MKFSLFLFFISGFSLLVFNEKIPDVILNYRSGTERYLIIVEKSTQRLFVYSNYRSEPVEVINVTTGKVKGQKQFEGDLKTPEGIYFFEQILSGDQLPKSDDYGEKAFTMNYPNPVDVYYKRGGSGIWLHGAYNHQKPSQPNNSRGCVVVKNGDLQKIARYIFLKQTPIIIVEKINFVESKVLEEKRERALTILKEWKESWEKKDIDRYISFYHSTFKSNGMNLAEFKAFKRKLNERYRFIRVFLNDVILFGFSDYFVAVFNQHYISDQNNLYSRKIQYWLLERSDYKLIDENNVNLPPPNRVEIMTGNYVTIDEFRRQILTAEKKLSEIKALIPAKLTIESTQISEEKIILKTFLNTERELQVIPVAHLIDNQGQSIFTSLPGVKLKNALPENFSQVPFFSSGKREIILTKEKNETLKSITIFLYSRNKSSPEQILTIFMND